LKIRHFKNDSKKTFRDYIDLISQIESSKYVKPSAKFENYDIRAVFKTNIEVMFKKSYEDGFQFPNGKFGNIYINLRLV
jgi:hypothetical protein